MSAVKSKVEELCHQFERDQEGTLLSEYPPQVIANTLKLYFRQLPEVCLCPFFNKPAQSDASPCAFPDGVAPRYN